MSLLERELTGHRKQWEKTVKSLEEHQTKVDELSEREEGLLSDVEEKERRVAQLEATLAEVCGLLLQRCSGIIAFLLD